MTPRSSSQPALQKPIHAQTTTQQASGQSYTSQQFTEANKSGNVVGGPVKLHEAAQQIVKSGWQLLNLSAQAAQLVLNAIPIDLARQPEPRARVYSLGSSEGRLQLPPVEYSLIVNMHNRYKNLVTVLASYLITPRGSFELLAFCDGCNAKTLQRAEKAFDTYLPIVWNGSAAACSLEFLKSVTGHVAPGKSNQRYWEPVREMCVAACGDAFFRQCGSLRRAVLVDQPSAIYETASNNRGAILAEGQFLIIMQDDWVMTQIGWNVHMSLPARLYLNEAYFLMDADDHAFHTSAVHSQGWVSGYVPLQMIVLGGAGRKDSDAVAFKDNGFKTKEAEQEYKQWRKDMRETGKFRQPEKGWRGMPTDFGGERTLSLTGLSSSICDR